MLLSEICSLVSVGRPLWWEDGSAICSVIIQWSESHRTRNHILLSHLRLLQPGGPGSRIYIPRNRVAQSYPRALGSFYVVSYDSQGYSGGILTLPQPGGPGPRIYRCPRRNLPDFERVFLMVKYTDITQNTYVQSWTVTKIMAREKCGLPVGPCTVAISWQGLSMFVLECVVMSPDTSSKLHMLLMV
jgi:hypothetical protein